MTSKQKKNLLKFNHGQWTRLPAVRQPSIKTIRKVLFYGHNYGIRSPKPPPNIEMPISEKEKIDVTIALPMAKVPPRPPQKITNITKVTEVTKQEQQTPQKAQDIKSTIKKDLIKPSPPSQKTQDVRPTVKTEKAQAPQEIKKIEATIRAMESKYLSAQTPVKPNLLPVSMPAASEIIIDTEDFSPALELVKDRVFTQELKQIYTQIKNYKGQEHQNVATPPPVKEENTQNQKKSVKPMKSDKASPSPQETSIVLMDGTNRYLSYPYEERKISQLTKLYNTEVLTDKSFHSIEKDLLSHFQADAVAFLLWDEYQGIYCPVTSLHIDESIKNILCFMDENDPFLKQDDFIQNWNIVAIQKDTKAENRLGKKFLHMYKEALIIKIQADFEQKPAFFMFFYTDMKKHKNEIDEIYLSFLKECMVLLQRLRKETWYSTTEKSHFDLIHSEILSTMKNLANYNKDPFHILHLRIDGIVEDVNWPQKLDDLVCVLSKPLKQKEKVIVQNIQRLVFLLNLTNPNTIIHLCQEFCEKQGSSLYVSLKQYPKSGLNLYSYLTPVI